MVVFWSLKSWILNSPLLLIYCVTLAKSTFLSIPLVIYKTVIMTPASQNKEQWGQIFDNIGKLLHNWWLLLLSKENFGGKEISRMPSEDDACKRNLSLQRALELQEHAYNFHKAVFWNLPKGFNQ